MAGTVTVSENRHGSVRKIIFDWTSSAGGAADATTTYPYNGRIIGLTTIPDGVAAPTDNYDVALTDADGHDMLLGAGTNRDTANTEHVAEGSLSGVAGSAITLAVTNAGSAKKGTVIVWIR